MKYITDTLDFSLERRSAVTLGKFDGLHRGHQKLVNRIREFGKDGFETVIFTFDVTPLALLGKGAKEMLLTPQERAQLARDLGVDCMIACPFREEIRNMEAEVFVREILAGQLRAAHLVVGEDFHFGHKRKVTPELLQELGPRYGFDVEILKKETFQGRAISSSWIREALRAGDMALVRELLGYAYEIQGPVVRGRQLGRKLGFPTINQIPDERKILPPFGVYISRIHIRGKEYKGISNLGCKPTVDGDFVGIETYLYDCEEDLYGAQARVELLQMLRPEVRFPSVEALREQLERDIEKGREILSNTFY